MHGLQRRLCAEFAYQPGDWLVFGAETSGLPPEAHEDVVASGGSLVKIPILDTHVRSINLAVCVGVGAFEALRQLDAGKHNVAPR
jgi:tRNA (cytidine/uridine-2'-O-)-methyltransferase